MQLLVMSSSPLPCYFVPLLPLLLLWPYSPRSLTSASLLTFIHSDLSWSFHLHPLIPLILRSAWSSSSHLSFGLPTIPSPSNSASNTILGILIFSIFIKCPSHSSLLRLTYLSLSGQDIFVGALFSNTLKLCLHNVKGPVSQPNDVTKLQFFLFSYIYIYIFTHTHTQLL